MVNSEGKVRDATMKDALPASGDAASGSGRTPRIERPKLLLGLKVLAVDDDQDARQLVHRILKRAGAEAEMASSASEAFEKLQRYTPDVIISDIGMPVENGYEWLKRLRSSTMVARQVPAMALTAWSRAEDRMKAMESGFQDHLAKPVNAALLESMVARLATQNVPCTTVP